MIDYGKFIELVNRLEGYKTRATNLHWVAKSVEEHKCAEGVYELINKYQDKLVEVYLSVAPEQIDSNSLTSGIFRAGTLNELLNDLLQYLSEYLKLLSSDDDDLSKMIQNVCEDFKIDVHIKKYLSNLG